MKDYGIDWDKSTKTFSTSVVIGEVSLTPDIMFTILRHSVRWDAKTQKDIWGTDYSIRYQIHGNSSAVVLETKEEVLNYLQYQESLLPQYLTLIGKREKLSERIKPLQNKHHKYTDRLHELAEK